MIYVQVTLSFSCFEMFHRPNQLLKSEPQLKPSPINVPGSRGVSNSREGVEQSDIAEKSLGYGPKLAISKAGTHTRAARALIQKSRIARGFVSGQGRAAVIGEELLAAKL